MIKLYVLALFRSIWLLMLTAGQLLAQDFSSYEWEIYDTSNSPLQSQFIVDILEHPNGAMYITTNNLGLYEYREGHFKQIEPNLPVNHWFMRMELDLEDRIYFTGNQGQMVIYDPSTDEWTTRDFPVQSLFMERNRWGTFLITTHIGSGVQLYQLSNDELTPIETKREDALGIFMAENGDAYVGFRDGAYKYPVDPRGTYTLPPEKVFDLGCYDFTLDSRKRLWAASYSSLHLHERRGDTWIEHSNGPKELYTDWNGKSTYVIHHLDVLPDNRIIISTQAAAGIAIWDGRQWEGYPIPGLPFSGIGVFRVASDSSIWLATATSGLAVFRPTQSRQPEPDPAILVIVPDGNSTAFLPDQGRTVFTQAIVSVTGNEVVIEVRDNQQVDNDTISLYLNGVCILSKFGITQSFYRIPIQLQPGMNELLLYAENVGKIPPNTIFLRISEYGIYQGYTLNSDLERCERLLIDYKME